MSSNLQWSQRLHIVGVIEQIHLVLYADHVGVKGPNDTARCCQKSVNPALGDVLVVYDLDGRSIECRGPGDIGLARRYRIDADEVRGGVVALPAVLELENCVVAMLPLLVMIALPAVLLLVNANSEVVGREKLGAFEELLTMPAPVNVRLLARAKGKRIGRRSGIEGKSAETVRGTRVER